MVSRAGYVLTSVDLQNQAMKIGNLLKGTLWTVEGFLQRFADIGNTAIIAAYQAGNSPTYVQDLVDLGAATTAMNNLVTYIGHAASASVTDNTGGAGLSNPTTGPTVTPQGTPGATTDFYQLIFHTLNGTTVGSTATPTTGAPGTGVGFTQTGPTTKSVTAYNLVTWTDVPAATQVDVLWWNGAAWRLKGSVAGTALTGNAFADTGQADSAYSVPTSNTTAGTTQTVSVPNGSIAVVTSDAALAAVLRVIGTDQTPYIRAISDLTAGST